MTGVYNEFKARWTDRLCVKDGLLFDDAATIPLSELPARVYELPPPGTTIRVLNTGPEATQAVEWLANHAYQVELIAPPPMAHGPKSNPSPILWRPSAFLIDVLAELPPGRAVDLGCGTGRDAVALACCGWQVTGLDILPDAIDRARLLESRYSNAPPIDWRVDRVERFDFATAYDLYVTCRFLDRRLLKTISLNANPGANVVVEAFTTTHRRRHGKPHPDRVVESGELPSLLPGMEIVRYEEAWRDNAHTARLWACRR